jgi:3-oxoacyl-[acyl-carrier protein] reductase
MKRALVTGGSSPIGAAICHKLAGKGLHVLVHAHASRSRAQEVVERIRAEGGSAELWCCDLTDANATRQALTPVLEAGVPQVIVHNAGTHDDVTMAGMAPAQWRDVLAVSLDGFFNVVQPLLLPLTRTRWGRIIALSSITAQMGNRGQVNYGAAKAGLEGGSTFPCARSWQPRNYSECHSAGHYCFPRYGSGYERCRYCRYGSGPPCGATGGSG